MSRRRLSDEERTLWKGVARSITPLRRQRADLPEADEAPASSSPAKVRSRAASKETSKPAPRPAPVFAAPPAPPKPVAPPALAPLGRKLKKRVARGSHSIDGRLDLHGLTQAEAHHALLGFLQRGCESGASIVLIITGKGRLGGEGERGVLKRQVPLWLRLPEFRAMIVGFESAGIGHGGEGALYVRLRRAWQD